MDNVLWVTIGVIATLAAMLPVMRGLLRRGEHRARLAERRARDAERLAELGSMTGGLAHEIRNPLSTVILNVALLAEGIEELDVAQEKRDRLLRRLDPLQREIGRLRSILDDFLQFAGHFKLAAESHDLAQLINELSDFFLPQCEQARVLLRVQVPHEPVNAFVDASLLKQALLNLLINAVQAMSPERRSQADTRMPSASRQGEIMLSLKRERDHTVIHVTDTGPGIDPEKLATIFRPYVSGRPGGTGLGLSIAKRVVDEHQGELTVDSEVGRGTSFMIRLPLDASNAMQTTASHRLSKATAHPRSSPSTSA
ncbi:MAG: sensor histidine kinase [Phycisphaerales bacterium]